MSRVPERERFIGDEDAIKVWWYRDGSLIDFSVSGYTYQAKLAPWNDSSTIVFTKTTGFTGAAGSGTENETGASPNLTVAFATTGELNTNTITEGAYRFQIKATNGASAETTYQMKLIMKARI